MRERESRESLWRGSSRFSVRAKEESSVLVVVVVMCVRACVRACVCVCKRAEGLCGKRRQDLSCCRK